MQDYPLSSSNPWDPSFVTPSELTTEETSASCSPLSSIADAVWGAVKFLFSPIGFMLSGLMSLASRDISSSLKDDIEMDDIIVLTPEEGRDEAREKFESKVNEATNRLRSKEMLTDNEIQFVILAMSLKYGRKCDLTLSQGQRAFEGNQLLVSRAGQESERLLQEEGDIRIRAVCIEGKKLFAFLISCLPFAKPVYSENHITGFINREYFDAKGLSYEESLHLQQFPTTISIEQIGKGFGRPRISDHPQIQRKTDRTTCGAQFLLRVEQYFTGKQGETLPMMSADEIQQTRMRFAELIEEQVLGNPNIKVRSSVEASSPNPGVEVFNEEDYVL